MPPEAQKKTLGLEISIFEVRILDHTKLNEYFRRYLIVCWLVNFVFNVQKKVECDEIQYYIVYHTWAVQVRMWISYMSNTHWVQKQRQQEEGREEGGCNRHYTLKIASWTPNTHIAAAVVVVMRFLRFHLYLLANSTESVDCVLFQYHFLLFGSFDMLKQKVGCCSFTNEQLNEWEW